MLRVGTSGWIYKEWAGTFYPKKMPKHGQLAFYAGRFDTVELNASFYRLPTENAARNWKNGVPENFIFAVKGSRFITHMKKLNIEPASMAIFFERIRPMAEKTGPILWQLPPQLPLDLPRLRRFIRGLPKRYRHAFEFRHPSWYVPETFDVLRRHRMAHVGVSSMLMPPATEVTSDFVYVRFHGLEGGARHDYTSAELMPWVSKCRRWLADGLTVWAYFNNDLNTRAPDNAIMFRELATTAPQRRRMGDGADTAARIRRRRYDGADETARMRRRG